MTVRASYGISGIIFDSIPDLTFCHLHMTNRDMLIFETFENPATYLSGELSDEGNPRILSVPLHDDLISSKELEIPVHEIPPNPDDSDILPSQVHPSYPYGNPTSLKHPANRPRKPTDPSSRALFSDLSYAGGGVNGALRWGDLALDRLLPIDRAREEAARAALARKMASGASQSNGPAPGQQQGQPPEADQQAEDSEEDEDEDEEDTDDLEGGSMNDEDEDENEIPEASYEEE